jgi:hypothetical protein
MSMRMGLRLQFLDLLEVFVWEIEDNESDDDTGDCRPEVAPGEEKIVDAVEEMPDAAPDEDEADNRREIASEVVRGNSVHTVEQM